jgi:thiamine biosynthesis lipoprotein
MVLFDPPALPAAGQLSLVRVSRRAMATTFEIAIPYGTPHAIDAGEAALDLIDRLEDQLTVYRDTSEVSRLNAAGSAVVAPQLFALLQRCAALTNDTAGAFDAACGALIKCWGFYKREGRVPSEAELSDAMHRNGFRHVVLDEPSRTVRFRRAGLELNLGAIGKGYALDRAADLLRNEWGIRSALLHGGGSSVLAVGVPPTDVRGWRVAVRHPGDDTRTLGSVYLADQALGTSAATYQYFNNNGKRYGHVLDPRTGRPADGVLSASCVANSAADADALSTAFFVAGVDWTADHCRSRDQLAAILLTDDGPPQTMNLPLTKYDPPGPRAVTTESSDW